MAHVLKRADMNEHHSVQLEPLSVRERMSDVLDRINNRSERDDDTEFVLFTRLFSVEEGRMGVVVTFLAIMELMREGMLNFVQNEAFGPIYLRAAGE